MTDSGERNPENAMVVAQPVSARALRDPERLVAYVDASTRALRQATTHTERLIHHRNWKAVLAAARELGFPEAVVEASIMVNTAERAVFRADKELGAAKGGRGNRADRDGIDPDLLKNIRKAHHRVDTRLFNHLVDLARKSGEPLTRKAIRRAGLDSRHGPIPESESREPYFSGHDPRTRWITPRYIIDPARRTMGRIDLDPASSERANEIVMARQYFTERDNGLRRRWSGRVWLNPPYNPGDVIEAFIERLIEHLDNGRVSQAMLLVNNKTETAWFRRAADRALALCLLYGRVHLHNPDGTPRAGSPWHGQVLMYFHAAPDPAALQRFSAEFVDHGRVYVPLAPRLA